MVEVQRLRTFYDFCGARATLCGDSRGRGSKTEDFFTISAGRARPRGDSRGRGSKTEDFLRFLRCRVRPSAEIRVVEAQKLRTFYDFCGARATLRRFAWSRFKNCGHFTISAGRARPSAEIVRVEALSLWRRANLS